MTLPFRRRHNDAEASHERARSLISTALVEPTGEVDAAWLATHLEGCAQCAADATAYAADHELLRGYRDRQPEPPRDLWARTSAAIEREGVRRQRGDRAARSLFPGLGRRLGPLPVGVASGLIVVIVVIGVSLAPRGLPLDPSGPSGSDLAAATPGSLPTPIPITAALAWIQAGANGSFEFRRTQIDSVCPDAGKGCATLDTGSTTVLNLKQAPQAVIQSPSGSELVVVTSAASAGGADVIVVPVPTAPPVTTPSPSVTPVEETTAPETSAPTPTEEATASVEPSPIPEEPLGHAIVSGVVVVGDAAYSPDGQWLAFSARPADGSAGPDLYLWHVGDDLAMPATTDHRTFFAGWLGTKVLANVVLAAPEGTPSPAESGSPSAAPTAAASPDPSASPVATDPPVEEHPVAFTLDPSTGERAVVAQQDMWLPVVDPTGRSVVYWAGTLIPDGTGTGWALGTGNLVIDGWVTEPPGPDPSDSTFDPIASASPGATDLTGAPLASWTPRPAGHPVALSEGSLVSFDAHFDPSGLHLAVWVADPSDPTVGTLRLIVLDGASMQIDPTIDPLPGVAALQGVSMNEGRLAWVTPPGQDGEGSHVQVLGWQGRDFGQVRTIQAERLFVVR